MLTEKKQNWMLTKKKAQLRVDRKKRKKRNVFMEHSTCANAALNPSRKKARKGQH
jgi:hypothetical protein